MDKVYFVSGIDTDAGKSYCTGWLARQWSMTDAVWSLRNLFRPAIADCRKILNCIAG